MMKLIFLIIKDLERLEVLNGIREKLLKQGEGAQILDIPKETGKSAFGLGQSPYNRRSQVGSYCINTDQLA